MGLSGIAIFKMLPKTNCGECGVPTCMAFAMALAGGKTELSKCPYVSDDAVASLSEASAPPIRTVEIGAGDRVFKSGGETVLFRHEKTFLNPTGFAVLVSDTEDDAAVDGKVDRFYKLEYDRVGLTLRADLIACKCDSGDAGKFAAFVEKVAGKGNAPLILVGDQAALKAGAEKVKGKKPLLYQGNADNLAGLAALGKEFGCSVGFQGDGVDAVGEGTKTITGADVKDVVIDFGAKSYKEAFEGNVGVRRAAIKAKARELGFPTITFAGQIGDGIVGEAMVAALLVAKYGGIVVLSDIQGHNLFPLLLQRLNIYTDPQRPMKTDEGLYEIGKPGPDSPLMVTSNFSLTYFIVSSEIETSRVDSHLLVVDTEGLSVLTAWAAGKFVGDVIGALVKKLNVGDKLNKKRIIIPGLTAIISGDLEEELGSEWEVLIGPREAPHIPAFLKEHYK
jgi:acetyl-CoA decarbonylase/synthase, CODH/ACS complex subunit gamma